MAKTTFELKNELKDFNAQIEKKSADIIECATNNEADKIAEMDKEIRSLETCRNTIKAELDKRNAQAQAQAELESGNLNGTKEERATKAKADFIRSAITNKEIGQETRSALGLSGLGGSTNGGEKFLPTVMTNTLISEPFVKNQLRKLIEVSNISGLELPKISYSLDDDDFITDEQTAKEIKLEGDKVSFGRFKFKVKARISDTIMHGTDLALTEYVDNALSSGLNAKERKVMMTSTPKVGEEHMSFYSTQNGIKRVQGETMYDAITGAIADLHEDYRENAKVVMTYADYIKMIKELSNGNTTLFTAPPEQIIGKPVEFCDMAVNPIVADFRFSRLNYDGNLVYDSDKDVDKGEYLFVLTGWFDCQIKLKSAFRIVEVKPTTTKATTKA